MNTALKVILGLVTAFIVISPILYIALWIWSFFSNSSEMIHNPYTPSAVRVINLYPLRFLFTLSLLFLLQGFYIVHNIVNKAGSEAIRAILGLGTYFLPFIALPVYYFIYILPKTPPKWALSLSAGQSDKSLTTSG